MNISFNLSTGWQIEDDGLYIAENTLEEAIKSFGEGMYQRALLEAKKMIKDGVDS